MLRKLKRIMVVIGWILFSLLGTLITIVGGLKLNDVRTRNNSLRQSHTIPDFLLMDFEVRAELDSTLAQQILSEVKPKISVPNGSIDDEDKLYLTVFFDEIRFKEKEQAKKNYRLSDNIYDSIRNFELMATSESKDGSVRITLTKNTNKVIFTGKDKNIKDSYIEVRDYDQRTNEFHILYHNIQMNVENQKLSRFITDLNKGELKLYFMSNPLKEITELKNIRLKTKTTDYFLATGVTEDSLGFNARLNLLIH